MGSISSVCCGATSDIERPRSALPKEPIFDMQNKNNKAMAYYMRKYLDKAAEK